MRGFFYPLQITEQVCLAVNTTSTYICDYDSKNSTSTVLAEYLSENACEKEKATDLGVTYDEFPELDQDFIARLEKGLHDYSHIDDEYRSL